MVRAALCLLLLLLSCMACEKTAPPPDASGSSAVAVASADPRLPPIAERKAAPAGFDGSTAWLNVTRPLAKADLDGRVVVVDFWTSCCINCLHTLPILAGLEKKYANQGLVVVGVHSPKFDAETENERLRSALAENEIGHPVAVDGQMKVWNAWSARSWPTIVVLDAHGRVVFRRSGEPDKEELSTTIAAALDEAKREGILKTGAIAGLAPEAKDTGPLAFPGKVIALANGDVAVSDTLHHRVVFTDASFKVKDVVGSGLSGAKDGTYGEASFDKPQGLAESGDLVYVADVENHLVRVIDRKAKTVSTVAGKGELAHSILKGKAKGRDTALRSPWDLAFTGGLLYVALAGSHQIAVFDPKDGTIAPFAGDGSERRVDGKGLEAAFAQPSGLATDGKTLWVADSETSSIRAINLATREVKTVVGKDLFVFGDVDGAADKVRLKHPLGLVYGTPKGEQAALWVVDTYNSKVKRIDVVTGSTRTYAKDLFEPSGIALVGGALVATDSKRHRLARISENKVDAVALDGLTAPPRGIAVDAGAGEAPKEKLQKVEIPEVRMRPDAPTTVRVTWKAPPGTAVNDDAPFKIRWNRSDGLAEPPADVKSTGNKVKDGFSIVVKPMKGAPNATLAGEIDIVICDSATHAVCVPVKRALELGFMSVKDASAEARIEIPLPEAKAQ
jgi:thiol-disulfide isomerase/thioredoxin/DNA-binding beta-propeller fold protein YncE